MNKSKSLINAFLRIANCYRDCAATNAQMKESIITTNLDHEFIILEQEIQNIYEKIPKFEEDKNVKPNDFSKREYNVKQIDYTNGLYFTAQISNNEKYLAYGGFDQILKIYDIKEDKIIKKKRNQIQSFCICLLIHI